MPVIDENSNMTLNGGSHDDETEVQEYKTCDCCPFGYHIDRDFVPFSKKMLSREGDVQKVEELKEKWRSKRQSMDKLLGIQTELWEIKTLSRPNRDIWEFDTSKVGSLHEKLASCVTSLQVNEDFESCDFTFGVELDQAVEEFEEVLARAKREYNTTYFPFPDDQKFHTFPRQKGISNGRDGETNLKARSSGITFRYQEEYERSTVSSENGMAPQPPSDEKYLSRRNFEVGRIQALEEQLSLIPQLQASLAALEKQNKEYLANLEFEKKRRLEVEEEMNSVIKGRRRLEVETDEKGISLIRKRTRDVSVGVVVLTRDVGVTHVQTTMRSIGVGGRIDTNSLERDSSSPTGSLSGRRRGRTFETGIQVNEVELLEKASPPPLLITEKCDAETQANMGEILTSKLGFDPSLGTVNSRRASVPKVITKNIGINVKPTTADCGIYFKPQTREGMSNTIRHETHQKCVGTLPSYLANEDLANPTKENAIDLLPKTTVGVNTLCPSVSTVGSSTSTLFTTQSNTAQTEVIEKHEIGIQMNSLTPDTSQKYSLATSDNNGAGAAKFSKSLESYNRIPNRVPVYRSKLTQNMVLTNDIDSPLSSSTHPKRAYMRSNTYTKEIPLDEGEGCSGEYHEDEVSDFMESKTYPVSSFDLSITTIPERREAVKPSKEMQGALKVLNDALLRGKTTEHVTSAIGIILHEWFRVSGSKSANAHDVEDYLDLYENYSPELLKYIVNMPDGNGNSAIHYAVSHGNFDVVSVLLDSNCCDINRANKAGYTCIMLLSLAKLSYDMDRHVVCRLCSIGDVNIKATQHGQTALMLAASHGRLETCRILLDAGADINIRDDDGSTALMCAAEHGHVELVNYFVTLPDCDLHITDNDGSTALNVAMEANHKDIGVTLYAHMHLVESPKCQRRRLSYPPASSPPTSNRSSPLPNSINRSAGNSPGTTKKRLVIPPLTKEKKEKSNIYGGGTESN